MTNALRLAGVTLPGTGYPTIANFITPDLPVKTGLVGLYVFGGDLTMSLINRANPDLPALAVGDPTIESVGAVLNGGNCIDTQLFSSAAGQTVIVIAKPIKPVSPATSAMLVSNYLQGTPSNGDFLAFGDASGAPQLKTFVATATGAFTGPAIAIPSDVDTEAWNLFAQRISSAGRTKGFWGKNGATLQSAEGVLQTRAILGRSLRIGGHYSFGTTYQANVHMEMAIIFQGEPSDADILTNMAYLRDVYGPDVGIGSL